MSPALLFMAKYRLKSAHICFSDSGEAWLPGDAEMQDKGDAAGTIVGDGTPWRVRWPTLEMEPLDDEARAMIEREEGRIRANNASMNPLDDLPLGGDEYEANYVPGTNKRRKEPKPDGAPAR